MSKSPITCHVLDSTLGKPAAGVRVQLEALSPLNSQFHILATGETNSDGRCPDLLTGHNAKDVLVPKGVYKMIFYTGEYFEKASRATFYPHVEVSLASDCRVIARTNSRYEFAFDCTAHRSSSSSQNRPIRTITSPSSSRRFRTPPTEVLSRAHVASKSTLILSAPYADRSLKVVGKQAPFLSLGARNTRRLEATVRRETDAQRQGCMAEQWSV